MILIPAIALGAAGSLHCAGMCGPIALAVPVGRGSNAVRMAGYLVYHFGRISAYAILGFLFGVLGYGLSLAGMQQMISIAAGAFMLLWLWVPGLASGTLLGKNLTSIQSRATTIMAGMLRKNRPAALLGIGFFNGLLPCGLVYLALAGSLVTYDPFAGALFMALFGIGTIPALLGVSLTGNVIAISWRSRFRKMAPVLASAIAVLFILRGLGLDIPFLSPVLGPSITAAEVCHP